MTGNAPSTCEPVTTTFARLHDGPTPLLLPTHGTSPSALAFVRAGYPAIATTSFGVAASAGRPDGGRTTRKANLTLATTLRHLPIPLSVDIEDGYDDDPDAVADYAATLSHTGVAAINIEDSTADILIDPARHSAKITAIKQHCPDLCSSTREWTPTGSARTPHPSTH
jgi:2-methylisocitrate lyase-like PEP mutase family enzyme